SRLSRWAVRNGSLVFTLRIRTDNFRPGFSPGAVFNTELSFRFEGLSGFISVRGGPSRVYKNLRQCGYASIVLLISLTQICQSQAQARAQSRTTRSGRPQAAVTTPNGISVGRPKVFDNRTLTLMLESLSTSLQNMQFVNRDALAAAFNFLQGSRTSEVVSNFSITPLPLPTLHQASTRNSGLVSSAGTPLPDTTTQKSTSDRPTFTPQPPALENPPAFPGFNPSFGQNPSDLLNDQVNLTYQIFNLRMLLE